MPDAPDPDDERPSVLDRLSTAKEEAATAFGRATDEACDECGEVEGSVTVNDAQDWTLCRSCKNDPGVLSKHTDG